MNVKLGSLAGVGMLGLLGLVGGCAQPLTYSNEYKSAGLRQFNSGQYLDAAGSFKAASKEDPADYVTQYYLGLSYEKSGDFQSAVEAYKLSLKLRPATPAGRYDVATREKVMARLSGLIARGNFADPEIDSIQREAQADRSPEDYRLLARVFALRGDPDSAIDSYRRAASFAPEDFALNKEYAFYLLKINQTAEGTRVLKVAWRLNPRDHQVAQTLTELGVTDSQLVVSSSRIEEQASDHSTPQTAWDVATMPKD